MLLEVVFSLSFSPHPAFTTSMMSTKARNPSTEHPKNGSSRFFKPNYKQIHARPLPINIHPLPPLIPQNPLSLLQICFMYLYQLINPPASHDQSCRGLYSLKTRSVHVVDEQSIRILWENGFFGKGNLSRSEPRWLDREKRRQGFEAKETSEEVTRRRREERREFKKERAKKERKTIEEKLVEEGKILPKDHEDANLNGMLGEQANQILHLEFDNLKNVSVTSTNSSSKNLMLDSAVEFQQPQKQRLYEGNFDKIEESAKEHLQLTPEEAFFLVFGIGVLKVDNGTGLSPYSTEVLFSIFRQNSYFPPCSLHELRPDDPFLLSYVVYHHFRSLGWVVRPGLKFAVDYLLYNRGPVFSHAEFAVVILPAYNDPYWHSSPTLAKQTEKKESKSWPWLHCLNRVQSQVRKCLLLVYVEVPRPESLAPTAKKSSDMLDVERGKELKTSNYDGYVHVTRILKRYKIRELLIQRWTPNRSRD